MNMQIASTDNIFRVMVSNAVWRMDVKVSHCVVNGTAINNSCPIILHLSSSAPLSDQSAFALQNCSTVAEETCKMSLYGPSVEQWQYLHISRSHIAPQHQTVFFKVAIYNVGEWDWFSKFYTAFKPTLVQEKNVLPKPSLLSTMSVYAIEMLIKPVY